MDYYSVNKHTSIEGVVTYNIVSYSPDAYVGEPVLKEVYTNHPDVLARLAKRAGTTLLLEAIWGQLVCLNNPSAWEPRIRATVKLLGIDA